MSRTKRVRWSALIEILGKRGAHRLGHHRHVSVVRVIEADNDLRARFPERRYLRRRERKADELHGRGLAVRVGVFPGRIGLAADLLATDFDERAILDAAEPGQ